MASLPCIKVIQFSDTHLGKTLYDYRRDEETQAILNEIVAVAREHDCDFFIHAGDVYDKFSPPSWAVEMFHDFLLELSLPGVIVRGNHDSKARLSEVRTVLRRHDIHVIVDETDPTSNSFRLKERGGEKEIFVAAMPWLSHNTTVSLSEELEDIERKIDYATTVKNYVERVCAPGKGLTIPKIFVGHAMLDAAIAGGSERALTVMDTYTVPQSIVPDYMDYGGVGHVHKRQKMPKAPTPTHYSGSTMSTTFGDGSDSRFVLILTFTPNKEGIYSLSSVEDVELSSAKKLVTLQVQDLEELRATLQSHPASQYLLKVRAPVACRYELDFRKELGNNQHILEVEYQDSARKIINEDSGIARTGLSDVVEVYGKFYETKRDSKIPSEYKEVLMRLYERFRSGE